MNEIANTETNDYEIAKKFWRQQALSPMFKFGRYF